MRHKRTPPLFELCGIGVGKVLILRQALIIMVWRQGYGCACVGQSFTMRKKMNHSERKKKSRPDPHLPTILAPISWGEAFPEVSLAATDLMNCLNSGTSCFSSLKTRNEPFFVQAGSPSSCPVMITEALTIPCCLSLSVALNPLILGFVTPSCNWK